jgi:hypothetical protein
MRISLVKKKLPFCQVRIKSEPFSVNLKFKSKHQRKGPCEFFKTTWCKELLSSAKHVGLKIQCTKVTHLCYGACKQNQ